MELDVEAVDEAEDFAYLCNNISKNRGSYRDKHAGEDWEDKGMILMPIWRSPVIYIKTRLRIFNTNVNR